VRDDQFVEIPSEHLVERISTQVPAAFPEERQAQIAWRTTLHHSAEIQHRVS
jgi:hypothetical protein